MFSWVTGHSRNRHTALFTPPLACSCLRDLLNARFLGEAFAHLCPASRRSCCFWARVRGLVCGLAPAGARPQWRGVG